MKKGVHQTAFAALVLFSCLVVPVLAEVPPPEWGLIVNIPEGRARLYRLSSTDLSRIDDYVQPEAVYPVAVGQKRYPTPVFDGSVLSKSRKPTWSAPNEEWAGEFAGTQVPFDSPDNPFRARSGKEVDGYFLTISHFGVGLHSTNAERSVGRPASHGCIRMRLEDVKHLFHTLPVGTPVKVVYNLYRLETIPYGFRVHVAPDVYKRFSRQEKIDHLSRHLAQHGLALMVLREDELALLLEGKSVDVTDMKPQLSASRPALAHQDTEGIQSGRGLSEVAKLMADAIFAMPR